MYLSPSPAPHALHKPALLGAVLVHALVLALLWWGAHWVAPKPTEVELWDAGSLAGANAVDNASNRTTPPAMTAPVEPSTPTDAVPSTASEPIPATRPDIATPSKKPERNTTPTPSTAPTTSPAKPTTATDTPPKANNSARTDVLAQIRQGSGSGTGAGSGSATGSGNSNFSDYKGKIESMIEARGRNQGLSGSTGRVSFRVAPNGSVSGVSVSGMPPDKAETLKRIISGMIMPRENGVIPPPALSGGMNFNVRI